MPIFIEIVTFSNFITILSTSYVFYYLIVLMAIRYLAIFSNLAKYISYYGN